jgi:hypothetical protein
MRRFLNGLLFLCVPAFAASGQGTPEYAVKIICGTADRPAVAPGTYFTAINIHNPSAESGKFQFKIALTMPQVAPGPISQFFGVGLKGDQAVEIDCTDIARRIQVRSRFLKGFVVIQSPTELDVVGVYTAANSPDGRVVTLEIERVPVRRTGQK